MSMMNVIRSSLYVRNLNLQNYIFGNQHDAQECLAYIRDHCCPDVNNKMFQIIIKESIVCKCIPGSFDTGCSKRIEKDVTSKILCLDVEDTNDQQSAQLLLNTLFTPYRCTQQDY